MKIRDRAFIAITAASMATAAVDAPLARSSHKSLMDTAVANIPAIQRKFTTHDITV